MKKSKCEKEGKFLTRAELINNSRKSRVLDTLPEMDKVMFDNFPDFKQSVGQYVDFSQSFPLGKS